MSRVDDARVDPAVVAVAVELIDDLVRLVERAASGQPTQRYHTDHVTSRLRDLRGRLARSLPRQRPPRRTPGDWHTDLALALGDTTDLPRAVLVAELKQLESAFDRAFDRRRRRWRWLNPVTRRPAAPATGGAVADPVR